MEPVNKTAGYISPEDFEKRIRNINNNLLKDEPTMAISLFVNLMCHILNQEGYGKGADIITNALLKPSDVVTEKEEPNNGGTE